MAGRPKDERNRRGEGRPCRAPFFVRNEESKRNHAGFPLACAFGCAFEGLAHAFATQRNMKIHAVLAAIAVGAGFALGIDGPSWAAIAVCIALVMAAECLNTAIEAVVDLVSPGYHELAKRAKDCAAGAVLLCAAGSVAVGAIVFVPRLAVLAGLA